MVYRETFIESVPEGFPTYSCTDFMLSYLTRAEGSRAAYYTLGIRSMSRGI